MAVVKFEIGKTYTGRNSEGVDCVISIVGRTEQEVTLVNGQSFPVGVFNGAEFINPLGDQPISLAIYATRPAVVEKSPNAFGFSPQFF